MTYFNQLIPEDSTFLIDQSKAIQAVSREQLKHESYTLLKKENQAVHLSNRQLFSTSQETLLSQTFELNFQDSKSYSSYIDSVENHPILGRKQFVPINSTLLAFTKKLESLINSHIRFLIFSSVALGLSILIGLTTSSTPALAPIYKLFVQIFRFMITLLGLTICLLLGLAAIRYIRARYDTVKLFFTKNQLMLKLRKLLPLISVLLTYFKKLVTLLHKSIFAMSKFQNFLLQRLGLKRLLNLISNIVTLAINGINYLKKSKLGIQFYSQRKFILFFLFDILVFLLHELTLAMSKFQNFLLQRLGLKRLLNLISNIVTLAINGINYLKKSKLGIQFYSHIRSIILFSVILVIFTTKIPKQTIKIVVQFNQLILPLTGIMLLLSSCSLLAFSILRIIQVRQDNTNILIPVIKAVSEATSLSPKDNMHEFNLQQDLKAATEEMNVIANPFKHVHILGAKKYIPITQRQMKQGWRYLRHLVREGPETEIDLESTVQQVGYQGFLLKPILMAPRQNKTHLIFLIDQEGSMSPFRTLADQLVQTAILSGRLGNTKTYYFHNCPDHYVYSDPIFLKALSIETMLMQISSSQTVILIFSDAGAARGGTNIERVNLTQSFLNRLKQKVRRKVWLNPLPKSRWHGTTASQIASQIPMYESSHPGVLSAINTLKNGYVS